MAAPPPRRRGGPAHARAPPAARPAAIAGPALASPCRARPSTHHLHACLPASPRTIAGMCACRRHGRHVTTAMRSRNAYSGPCTQHRRHASKRRASGARGPAPAEDAAGAPRAAAQRGLRAGKGRRRVSGAHVAWHMHAECTSQRTRRRALAFSLFVRLLGERCVLATMRICVHAHPLPTACMHVLDATRARDKSFLQRPYAFLSMAARTQHFSRRLTDEKNAKVYLRILLARPHARTAARPQVAGT